MHARKKITTTVPETISYAHKIKAHTFFIINYIANNNTENQEKHEKIYKTAKCINE